MTLDLTAAEALRVIAALDACSASGGGSTTHSLARKIEAQCSPNLEHLLGLTIELQHIAFLEYAEARAAADAN